MTALSFHRPGFLWQAGLLASLILVSWAPAQADQDPLEADAIDKISLPPPRTALPPLTTQQPTIVTAPPQKERPAPEPEAPAETGSTDVACDCKEAEPEPEKAAQVETLVEEPPPAVVGPPVAQQPIILSAPSNCPGKLQPNWRKNLMFTAFSRQPSSNSNAAALNRIEWQMPTWLAEQLAREHQLTTRAQLTQSLPQDPAQEASTAASLAQRHRAQLLVSGAILNTDMHRPQDVYQPRWGARMRNRVLDGLELVSPHDTRARQFVFRLTLHDGLTGERLFDRVYQTQGLWNTRAGDGLDFNSPQVGDTHYGQAVSKLLVEASEELAAVVECLPHKIAMDDQPHYGQARLEAGADQGLRPGDRLLLARVVQHPGVRYGHYDTQVLESDRVAVVTAVFPTYSLINAESVMTPGRFVAMPLSRNTQASYAWD